METKWNKLIPSIFFNADGSVKEIQHSHAHKIEYEKFYLDNENLRRKIGEEVASLHGCVAFFKTYADHYASTIRTKAICAAIVAEDNELIKEFERNRPGPCKIL